VLKIASFRDGDDVFCARRQTRVDLEGCFHCPSYRDVTAEKVICSYPKDLLFDVVSRGLPFAAERGHRR
jgi:hypothetical protein